MNKITRKYLSVLASVGLAALLCASPALAQVAPPLGQAGSFAALAGSTLTNTGNSAIIGDVGVSPGTAITGFPPGVVTGGTIHSNDAVATQAQSDLTTAYNFLAGQAFNFDLTGQDLGGLTLTAGVYRFSSSAQLTGILTLNAQGNANAVFIFQIGSTLTTASSSSVLLINGGQNCNVFWQVGSSATLGTTSAVAGNILALTSITLTTGASLSGRALARNGAVTLDTNNVTVCPACPNPITLSPATLPNGTLGVAYSQTITASGGTAPYTFSVIAGSLPPALALAVGGTLSGTPTTAGSFTFTVRATDSAGCFGSQIYTIVINPAGIVCPPITLFPATLPAATAGTPYSQTITASPLSANSFSITGALPPGLSPTLGGGVLLLSGTPTTPGSFTFTVTATDTVTGCFGSQIYTLLVNCPTITISPATLPAVTAGTPYSQAITASPTATYTFSVTGGALPPGLSLASSGPSTALLSGTLTTPGSFTFTITATDTVTGCLGSQIYTVLVNCPTITISPIALPNTARFIPYNQQLTASGGTGAVTFLVTGGSLPAGITLSPSGLLSGQTATAGAFNVTISATDSNNCAGSQGYAFSVAAEIPTLSEWGLILLAGLLALVGFVTLRKSGRMQLG